MDLEYVNCNLCHESDTRLYAKVSYLDYLSRRPDLATDDDPVFKHESLANHKFNLVKCKNCGFIYVNPRLKREALAKLYHKHYFKRYADIKSEHHRKRQQTMKCEIAELERVREELQLGKKILDVGCGGGFFLAGLDDSWDKQGIDINASAVRYGKDAFGVNILEGNLRELNLPCETFDVVKMRAIIEHVPDPMDELQQVYRVLRKGGLIAVMAPNQDSICGRIYRGKSRMVEPLHHIYCFSTKTLSLMLKRVGFKVQKVSYHYFDTPYASWKDSLKILYDVVSFNILRKNEIVSPPFYGNIIDIYAVKEI